MKDMDSINWPKDFDELKRRLSEMGALLPETHIEGLNPFDPPELVRIRGTNYCGDSKRARDRPQRFCPWNDDLGICGAEGSKCIWARASDVERL